MDQPGPNRTMFQGFEWYSSPGSRSYWSHLKDILPTLETLGIDTLWIPPGCKAGGKHSNGYDVYDLYDLGEFEQKGSKSTKWGVKEDLVDLVCAANEKNIGVLWDAVLGHRGAADYKQACRAVKVEDNDRTRELEGPKEIEAWVGFDFSGRGTKYSALKHDAKHFNGVDYDHKSGEKAIYKLINDGEKDWAQDVDEENGNYDYLLCANVDLMNADVREDLFHWASWINDELQLSGLRIDAARHMSRSFIRDLIERSDPNWFIVGEYATSDLKSLVDYADNVGRRMYLFDFPLHGNFVRTSNSRMPDIRNIFVGSLVKERPDQTVTFVTNHDTQSNSPGIAPYFVLIAYAIILISEGCGCPCVFYGDLYGTNDPDMMNRRPSCNDLAKLLLVRKRYAYGKQNWYLDDPYSIGFTRIGSREQSSGAGVAVTLSTSSAPTIKRMDVGEQHAGEKWSNVLDASLGQVTIDDSGSAAFPTNSKTVGVWLSDSAEYREELDSFHI